MKNRRSFLKTLSIGTALTSFALMPKRMFAKNEPIQNVLLHHVYFWLKNPDSETERTQFEKAIGQLLEVETIGQSHFGIPAGTENRDVVDHSYTYSLLILFNSQAEQDSYQSDPIHLKFVEENSQLWNKIIVYDSTNIES